MNKEELEKIIQSRMALLEDNMIDESGIFDDSDKADFEKEYKALQSLTDELLLTRDTDQFFANNYEIIKSIIPDLPKDYEMSPLEKDVYVDDEGELRYSPDKVMAWYGVEPDTKQGGYSDYAKKEFFNGGWTKMGMPKKAYANGKRTQESVDMMNDLTKYANEYAKDAAFGGFWGGVNKVAFPRLYEAAKAGKFDDASSVADLYLSPEFAKDYGEQVLYTVTPTKVLGKSKPLSNVGKTVSKEAPGVAKWGKSAIDAAGVPLITTAWDMPGYDEEGNFSLTQNDFDTDKFLGGTAVNFGVGRMLDRQTGRMSKLAGDDVAEVATRTAKSDYAKASRDMAKLEQIKNKAANNKQLTTEDFEFLDNLNNEGIYTGLGIDAEIVDMIPANPEILDQYINHIREFRDKYALGGSEAHKKTADFAAARGMLASPNSKPKYDKVVWEKDGSATVMTDEGVKNFTPDYVAEHADDFMYEPISNEEYYRYMGEPQFQKEYDMGKLEKGKIIINNSKVGQKVSDVTDFMNTQNLMTNELGANSPTIAGGAVRAIPGVNDYLDERQAQKERKNYQMEKALKAKKRKEVSDKKSKEWRWKNGYATPEEMKTEEYQKFKIDQLHIGE